MSGLMRFISARTAENAVYIQSSQQAQSLIAGRRRVTSWPAFSSMYFSAPIYSA